MNAITRAIELVGMSELARRCGVTRQAVEQWHKAERVPAERVLAIEAATESRVTRYELRPDIYPREWQAPAQRA